MPKPSAARAAVSVLCFLAVACVPAAFGAEAAVPRPAALERDVEFWIRVYTEVTTSEGLLHDENNLGVVYEKMSFPANATPRERDAVLDAARDRYAAALRRIAAATSGGKLPESAVASGAAAASARLSATAPDTAPATDAAGSGAPNTGADVAAAASASSAGVTPAPAPAPVLAAGATAPGEGLSADDRRILEMWGPEGTPERLLQATHTIRFQLGQADRFRAGLVRSGAWEGHIADALANLGLPPEIAALPHVESSFNPAAYSKVGAAGLWQFMRSTGRRYMRIDTVVDERLDPFRSTEAAAQLLAYNYRILGSWPLAITAYNHGAAGMRRARDAMGTEDIVAIARNYKGPAFGFASRNFYVSFLAALAIEQNPEKYFGPIERVPEQRFREIPMPAYVPMSALERTLKVDRDTLRGLNPALQPPVWDGQRLVPRGYRLRLPQRASDWTSEKLAAQLPADEQFAGQIESRAHRVKKGDTLGSVAARYGLAADLVARLNHLAPDAALRPGRTLRLPDRHPALLASTAGTSAARAAAAAADTTAEAGSASGGVYVVRRGEALSDIASRVGVSQADLIRFNQLRDSDFIFEGQKLHLVAQTPQAEGPTSELVPPQSVAESPAAAASGGPAPVPSRVAAVASPPPGAARAADKPAIRGASAASAPDADGVSRSQEEAQGPSLVPGGSAAPQVTDAVDYSVAHDGTVRVAAAETLGHYAEWLGLGASKLRALNHLSPGRPILFGQKVKLDFARVTHEQFEQRRRDYHAKLQTDFFDAHRIDGTEIYIARRGDSLWTVTQRYSRLPAWLLQEYNPDVDFGELRPGTQLLVPRVEEVASAN